MSIYGETLYKILEYSKLKVSEDIFNTPQQQVFTNRRKGNILGKGNIIFYFFDHVFKGLSPDGHQNFGLCVNGLTKKPQIQYTPLTYPES